MITKINKIKNLGLVFGDYVWDSNLRNFEKCNLIYGWNGSGKTTLSKLFDALSGSQIENLEYEVEDERGSKYTQDDTFPKKIRVFNQDYIRRNVELLKGCANTISILLGEENKELVESIKGDEKILNGDSDDPKSFGKIALRDKCLLERNQKVGKRNTKFTDIARTIGAAIGGNALRDYRKPQAERDLSSLKAKEELSDPDLDKYSTLVAQRLLDSVPLVSLEKVQISGEGEFEIATLLGDVIDEAEIILGKTVESEIINRLAKNEDLYHWVEEGVSLHKKHSSDVCEYCLQKVSATRAQQLTRYFNEEDKKIKSDLSTLIGKLDDIQTTISSLYLPDKARFYDDKQNDFETAEATLTTVKQAVLEQFELFSQELEEKKTKTTESVTLKIRPDTGKLTKEVDAINKIVSSHNKTTADFEKVKERATENLKNHYLSTIYDDVKDLDSAVELLEETASSLEGEVEEIRERISRNMAQISSTHKACGDLNAKLATFLGRNELKFVPHAGNKSDEDREGVTGYDILRGSNLATHLSESEKTAIAFIYFIVHLGDQDFEVADGIIVVDDPVSSLDSNSLFQAFSFLKNSVKDADQVFILTHNFDFLKLLINWRKSAGGAGYYMLKNNFSDDVRYAFIDKMDKELCEYESEYHYLFKLLKQLKDEQDGTIARAYPIPNIARKVWDTFLMFSVPNGKSPYKKMEELKVAGFDVQKLDAIYKFTNDQSHITGSGFDPALVPETKKVVNELFEMIEIIVPEHFRIIDQATN